MHHAISQRKPWSIQSLDLGRDFLVLHTFHWRKTNATLRHLTNHTCVKRRNNFYRDHGTVFVGGDHFLQKNDTLGRLHQIHHEKTPFKSTNNLETCRGVPAWRAGGISRFDSTIGFSNRLLEDVGSKNGLAAFKPIRYWNTFEKELWGGQINYSTWSRYANKSQLDTNSDSMLHLTFSNALWFCHARHPAPVTSQVAILFVSNLRPPRSFALEFRPTHSGATWDG